ncbi:MAG: ergothioneine biosynthesis protein EgtB [Candidatus Thiodiazotropha lotti]|nr:ergothioneine biosynthesis protein EgtB [Candidatus Thiodiazotropha lotti]MCG8003156.1 ergothioneine biosynthesis protein EgtB [Candidatus Thiodiazotropha lotti]MCW4220472.1 ergothioneine biosynthesis protein EgtB [Candidatus Thiodiazotropha lotti]
MKNIQMDSAIARQTDREQLIEEFRRVRKYTETLCAPLSVDDYQIQSIAQTSPPKWHIAHVTWFFEAFVLLDFDDHYECFDGRYDYLFNSYYYTHGKMHPRPDRGLLSRPTVEQIYRYRHSVDLAMERLMSDISASRWEALAFRVTLGLNHEQQHQELLLMDIKHNFSVNPLKPAYRDDLSETTKPGRAVAWVERTGGIYEIGSAEQGFAYDNETPRHKVLLRDHLLADRFVTNGEYLAFVEDGAYRQPALWLADGWARIQSEDWRAPLYWQSDGEWVQFTLGGLRPLEADEPVCHLNYFEADAYARWAGKRLPTEAELESMLADIPVTGHFADRERLHPEPAGENGQWFGDLWAWTASPYAAYPGFKPLAGSMGEYNGKFMSNQIVLKGGSCVTPPGHTRASYRNFFYPDERWAFTGLRLAEDM